MQTRSFALSTLAAVILGSLASTAQAGPLIDWLFRGRQTQPSYPVGAPIPLGNGYAAGYPGYAAGYQGYPGYAAGYPGYTAGYPTAGYAQMPPVGQYPAAQYNPTPYNPVPQYPAGQYAAGYAPSSGYAPNGYAANMGNYYGTRLPVIGPNGAGYTAQMPTGIAAATLPQAAMPPSALPQTAWPQPMSYVPNYNSNALRAPVTYYRPLLTTDPNTGAQVVAMAPCTSYQYLTQRVPALGQTALYGSYQPPQPMLQTTPTYTLPSGGIPLASGSVAPSTMGSGAVLGYSPYSTYQVSPTVSSPAIVGSSTYPTTPLGSTYSAQSYSYPSGGSTGSYSQPIPGLVAPQSQSYPSSTYPPSSYPSPAYPSSINPSTTAPGSVMPPPATGSNFDPANTPPSLPLNSTLRPRLQSIVPEVSSSPSGAESAQKSSAIERSLLSEPTKDFPVTNPIPAPEGMEKPSWSPGLLRNEDMTALRPAARRNELAGQSKKIHWASFEQDLKLSDSSNSQPKPMPSQSTATTARQSQVEQPARQTLRPSTSTLELGEPVGSHESQVKQRVSVKEETPVDQRPTMVPLRPSPVGQPAAKPSTGTYDNNGWTATRK